MLLGKYRNHLGKTIFSSPKVILRFAIDVFRTGKLEEIFSFFIWEFCHRLRLFKKSSYLVLKEHNTKVNIEDFFNTDEINFNTSSVSRVRIKTATVNWHILHFDAEENIWGTTIEDQNTLLFQNNGLEATIKVFEFPSDIKAMYISHHGEIFVCVNGRIYRSIAKVGFTNFEVVLSFTSNESVFRHNNAFTETPDGTLLIGEYACLWESNKWNFAAILYFSNDSGKTWNKSEFLRKAKVNKHIHLIKYSKTFKKLILTEGDNKKRIWIKKDDQYTQESLDCLANWETKTKFHIQMGGYTSMAEINGRLIFGTDYMGGTNFIVQTEDLKKFTRKIVPDPFRKGWFTNMVVTKEGQIWATLFTRFSSKTKSILMCSSDHGKTWEKVISYDGTKFLVDIISSSIDKQSALYVEIREIDKEINNLHITKTISCMEQAL